ncbi:hypothetical protein MIS45_07660 [Wielerella bovis]|uniref:hypothetical protein n=1 Tax=Wielerella bovis TaxID=2917790 RepID=UPI002019D8ED|nr:hypothetical protein [Wielerella bovis]ULJ68668.1 hypothetical protein MIS45_07660 [Wielerella bovis]
MMQNTVIVYYRLYDNRPHVAQLSLPVTLLSSLTAQQLRIYLCGYVDCYPDNLIRFQIIPVSQFR